MRKIILGSFLCVSLLFSIACSSEANKLYSVPDKDKKINDDKEGVIDFTSKVDILFIVDDSGSMGTHQNNLLNNIGLFSNEISKARLIDFNIGVITTDMYSGNKSGRLQGMPKFVNKSSPDMGYRLAMNLRVGTSGSGWELVFDPLYAALTPPLTNFENRDFYRDDAHLAVVVVTDAEDQSTRSPMEAYNFLLGLKNMDPEKLSAYGVIIPTGVQNCYRDETNTTPKRIETFIDLMRGFTFNLCDPDFGTKLASIGDDIRMRVMSFIPLKKIPIVETIQVRYGNQVIPADFYKGWSYDAKRIGLRLGAELELEPEPEGTPLRVSFIPAKL